MTWRPHKEACADRSGIVSADVISIVYIVFCLFDQTFYSSDLRRI